MTLFGQMISQNILPGWRIYAAAEGNRKYGSIMKYRTEQNAIEMVFSEQFPQGMTQSTLNATQGDIQPLCVEFKYELSSVLSEFDSELETSKQFAEVDVLIAWKADGFTDGCKGDYLLESCSYSATVHQRTLIGQTHILRRSAETSSIPVILLRDLFSMANNWELEEAVQRGSYFRSDRD